LNLGFEALRYIEVRQFIIVDGCPFLEIKSQSRPALLYKKNENRRKYK
jgi:hypothetical protein